MIIYVKVQRDIKICDDFFKVPMEDAGANAHKALGKEVFILIIYTVGFSVFL